MHKKIYTTLLRVSIFQILRLMLKEDINNDSLK